MRYMSIRTCLIVVGAMLVSIGVVASVAADGSDQVIGSLRVDLPEVYNSGDYRATYFSTDIPTAAGGFTAGWLGLDLAQRNGTPYSAHFTQVGLMTDKDGIYWFVYAEPGVNCLSGDNWWGTCPSGWPCGCRGKASDLVSAFTWQQVELVTYGQGYWIARVYDGNQVPHDVARIFDSSTRIYYAQSVTEEAYSGSSDPYLSAYFYHSHPQYLNPSTGFVDWPVSSGGHDSIVYVTDLNGHNSFCPQYYGMVPNIVNDERIWYAGTSSGQQCAWLLFPSAHAYLPLTLKQPTPVPTIDAGG